MTEHAMSMCPECNHIPHAGHPCAALVLIYEMRKQFTMPKRLSDIVPETRTELCNCPYR